MFRLVCFDIALKTNDGNFDGFRFRFNTDSCYPETYSRRCCLPPGDYVLTCKHHPKYYWWGEFLEFQGNRYCDDFLGYRAMRRVTIFGIDNSYFEYLFQTKTSTFMKYKKIPLSYLANIIVSK